MPPAASLATSLKKGEGEPLNRNDIQYTLLQKIFEDRHAVFTPRDGYGYSEPGDRVTFGDLYIQDFLDSTKLSKTLKEKFVNDPVVTRKVCMASLLVNTGRINTTLVFTPTQARTYNPIPCIQAYGSGHKMLQDAPRLKGILKGSCENVEQSPVDWIILRDLQNAKAPKPITNPINLVFLLSSSATTIDKPHFKDYAFLPHELLSDTRFTTDSRATAFLWLMYFYIESNATLEDAQTNPFGPSPGEFLVPTLETTTEAESLAENIDLPIEIDYSTKMWEERKKYLALSAQKAAELAVPRSSGGPNTPSLARTASADAVGQSRASSVTPSTAAVGASAAANDDSVRRSSRKVKRKTYDSGADLLSDNDLLMYDQQTQHDQEEDDWVHLRTAQILRHRLRRSQHQAKKSRRTMSVIERAYKMTVETDDFTWDDSNAEEAKTLARVLRRAERRAEWRSEGKEKRALQSGAPTTGTSTTQHVNSSGKKSSGTGFKIKLKF